MGFWTAMVLISGLAVIWGVLSARYRAQAGIGTDSMGGQFKLEPSEDAVLRKEVEELRERVKVLERIATEDRETKLLSAEIENLREK